MTASSHPRAASEQNAYRIVEMWSKAFTAADVDGISSLYAPDATMIGTRGTVVMTTPAQIRSYFDVALNQDRPRTATLNDSESVAIDDNTVVISGFDTITSVRDGQPVTIKGRVTFVVVRRGVEWKIVHLHRSPLSA